MKLDDFIKASLDAGDYGSASLGILAHPSSTILSKPSVMRLWDFANNGVVVDAVDEAMIEALGDLMCLREGFSE